jgi:hypothetical protein
MHPPTNRATTAAKHPPRSGSAHSRQQSIYQRGGQRANVTRHLLGNHRRSSIRQGRRHPLWQNIHSGGGHDTLSSKAYAKRRPTTTATKHPPEKATARTTPARSSAVGQTIAVEHINAQAGTVRNFPSNRLHDGNR